MRLTPARAGWLIVTTSYRRAAAGVVVGGLFALLMASGLLLDAIRHRPFDWYLAVWLLVAVIWTVRLTVNLLWLRRDDA